ncbi:MAG: aldo/keto reductase [Chloroflexota bacterium]|nr:aldo/keto reductase [Chloroflexota bacterium]
MNYRTLGRTGLNVSEVGFGGAGIGHVWGPTTDEECIRSVRLALDLGINFFDTSPMYGGGKSEENLGKGLAGRREQAIIATKVRLQAEEDRASGESMAAAVRSSVDQSLTRLGTDYVDVLQVHHQVGAQRGQYMAAVGPPPRYALLLDREDCLSLGHAMKEMVKEGKVRFIGITAWDGDPDAVRAVLKSGVFDTAQVLYNLLNRTAVAAPPSGFDDMDQGQSLPIAREGHVGVIGIRSHAAGALVDRLDREAAPDTEVARDHRRARNLWPLLSGQYSTSSQAALRFCLDNPDIATVVPGFKNAAEMEEAAACSDLPSLPAEALAALDSLYRRQFEN